MSDIFHIFYLVFVVVMLFNVMIFVHELGHFLAARWRGLQVDRFQIWFGKPIWKKTVNGVQYGLGWLPFGGFVALPQMAAMESIEGDNLDQKVLPPVSPLDKIIVAVAGPVFSLLLAIVAALVVWGVGKPQDAIKSNIVGAVEKDMPAEGVLQPGDKVLKVNGEPVTWFGGRIFDDISTRIMLTKGDTVAFEIEREGEVLNVETNLDIADRPAYKRRALPRVGIRYSAPAIVAGILEEGENGIAGPAERAGIKVGDEIIAFNGQKIYSPTHVSNLLEESEWKECELTLKRDDEILKVSLTPLKPLSDFYKNPMIGISWDTRAGFTTETIYPNPWEQVSESMKMMTMTISAVASPSSHVGVDQLNGPVGIGRTKYLLLQQPDGWARVLAFFVLFNINLAILNMLPLPVLDGGHIVMSTYEWIFGKPLPQRFTEILQTGFALLLMGFMLFITTKDIGEEVPDKEKEGDRKVEWPEPSEV